MRTYLRKFPIRKIELSPELRKTAFQARIREPETPRLASSKRCRISLAPAFRSGESSQEADSETASSTQKQNERDKCARQEVLERLRTRATHDTANSDSEIAMDRGTAPIASVSARRSSGSRKKLALKAPARPSLTSCRGAVSSCVEGSLTVPPNKSDVSDQSPQTSLPAYRPKDFR